MNDPILTRFEQLEVEIERLRANLNVRSRTIAALLQRAERAEATLDRIRVHCEARFAMNVVKADDLFEILRPGSTYGPLLNVITPETP